jgi:1-deoxy-D-xylulose-5-phosphate reductoisomerase
MMAQLSPSSMTFPIQHALLYPERVPGVEPALDLTRLMHLDFRPIDDGRFPMMRLAKEAMTAGGIAPAVYNAANEVAVAAFLNGNIPFLAIPWIVEQGLARTANIEPPDLASVLAADNEARRGAESDVLTLK